MNVSLLFSLASMFAVLLVGTVEGGGPGVDGRDPVASAPVVGPSKAEYHERRRDLMAKIKQAEAMTLRSHSAKLLVVVVGEGPPEEDGRFRQSNDFHYLTGVDEPDAAAILRADSGEETLYLPPRNPASERWTGPKIGPGAEGASATGFDRVESSGRFLGDLFRDVEDPRVADQPSPTVVYLVEPVPRAGSMTRSARFSRFLREGAPSSRFKDVSPRVHEMRKVKSSGEVALIRRAIAVTADAQAFVVATVRPGLLEYQLEGGILGAFVAGGGSRAGFPSIIGSGPNSTVLHYEKNRRMIEDGDLVVVDIGGEVQGYTADITRTYPASGKFTPRQREVYQLVLDAQSKAAKEFHTGKTSMSELTGIVTTCFQNSPLRARDEDGTERTMDHFFIHGLGHNMGLDVHDVGQSAGPLLPGQVFTIEPGLYIRSEGFGVRIEDDYLVTPDGLEKLSEAIPSDPDDLERRIAQRRATGRGTGGL